MNIISALPSLLQYVPQANAIVPFMATHAFTLATAASAAELVSFSQKGRFYGHFNKLSCYIPVVLTAALSYETFKNHNWSLMVASGLLTTALAAKVVRYLKSIPLNEALPKWQALDNQHDELSKRWQELNDKYNELTRQKAGASSKSTRKTLETELNNVIRERDGVSNQLQPLNEERNAIAKFHSMHKISFDRACHVSKTVIMISRFALIAFAYSYAKLNLDAVVNEKIPLVNFLGSALTVAFLLHTALLKKTYVG